MTRSLPIDFAAVGLAALLMAGPAFAADGDCMPFWKCGTTPAGLQDQQVQDQQVTELNGPIILAEFTDVFSDDVYSASPSFGQPSMVILAEFNDDVYHPYPLSAQAGP